MIIDSIENDRRYAGLSDKIAKAFEFIRTHDLVSMPCGRYAIDHEDIFAMVQEYETKMPHEGNVEGHYRYIDIQYVIQGGELMGVTQLKNQQPIEINREADYAFYSCNSTLHPVEAGMFAIFFPNDLHMPCIRLNDVSKVKKVVIKVGI